MIKSIISFVAPNENDRGNYLEVIDDVCNWYNQVFLHTAIVAKENELAEKLEQAKSKTSYKFCKIFGINLAHKEEQELSLQKRFKNRCLFKFLNPSSDMSSVIDMIQYLDFHIPQGLHKSKFNECVRLLDESLHSDWVAGNIGTDTLFKVLCNWRTIYGGSVKYNLIKSCYNG